MVGWGESGFGWFWTEKEKRKRGYTRSHDEGSVVDPLGGVR